MLRRGCCCCYWRSYSSPSPSPAPASSPRPLVFLPRPLDITTNRLPPTDARHRLRTTDWLPYLLPDLCTTLPTAKTTTKTTTTPTTMTTPTTTTTTTTSSSSSRSRSSSSSSRRRSSSSSSSSSTTTTTTSSSPVAAAAAAALLVLLLCLLFGAEAFQSATLTAMLDCCTGSSYRPEYVLNSAWGYIIVCSYSDYNGILPWNTSKTT